MRAKSAKYLGRARAFVEAVDIAVELRATPPSKDQHLFDWYVFLRTGATPPYRDPVNANLRGLAALESIFFTEWNEGSGEVVERFWQLVADRGLPFARKDIVRDVLARGRINSEAEYHAVTDSIVIHQQMGRLSPAEADKLDKMLAQFAQRASKRHAR